VYHIFPVRQTGEQKEQMRSSNTKARHPSSSHLKKFNHKGWIKPCIDYKNQYFSLFSTFSTNSPQRTRIIADKEKKGKIMPA
jgi:hypothetical protein